MTPDARLEAVLERWFEAALRGERVELLALCDGDAALCADAARLLADDPLAGAEAAPAAPRVLGEFVLLELLGQGGMGSVYRAEQLPLRRPVAVKVLTPAAMADPTARQRFRREAALVAALAHPNIVPLYAIGDTDEACYLVMPLLSGPALDRAPRPMDPREVARIGAEVADALDAAHVAGVVHRDVKPANILLDHGRPVLVDFGLARSVVDPTLTDVGTVPGTLTYLAPERLRAGAAHRPDPRSDIYSLGATLYELLAGRPLFAAREPRALLAAISNELPPPLRLPAPARDLATIVQRAVAKDPERRFPTAREVAADLRRFLAGQPIHARPIGLPERARWLVRAHPKSTLALGLAVVGIATLAIVGVAEHVRAQDLTHQAFARATAAMASRRFDDAVALLAPLLPARSAEITALHDRAAAAAATDQLLVSLTAPAETLESAELGKHAQALAASTAATLWPRRTAFALALADLAARRLDAAKARLPAIAAGGGDDALAFLAQALDTAVPTAAAPVVDSQDPEDLVLLALAMRASRRPVDQIVAVLAPLRTVPVAVFLTATVLGDTGDWQRARGLVDGLAAGGIEFPHLWRARARFALLAGDPASVHALLAAVPPARWTAALARIEIEALLADAADGADVTAARARLREHLHRWPRASTLLRLQATCRATFDGDPAAAAQELAALRPRADLTATEREFAAADELLVRASLLPEFPGPDRLAVAASHRAFLADWAPIAADFVWAAPRGIAATWLARSEIYVSVADADRLGETAFAQQLAAALERMEGAVTTWPQSPWPLLELANVTQLLAWQDLHRFLAADAAPMLARHRRCLQQLLDRHDQGTLRLAAALLVSVLAQQCEHALGDRDLRAAQRLQARLAAAGPAAQAALAVLGPRIEALAAERR